MPKDTLLSIVGATLVLRNEGSSRERIPLCVGYPIREWALCSEDPSFIRSKGYPYNGEAPLLWQQCSIYIKNTIYAVRYNLLVARLPPTSCHSERSEESCPTPSVWNVCVEDALLPIGYAQRHK